MQWGDLKWYLSHFETYTYSEPLPNVRRHTHSRCLWNEICPSSSCRRFLDSKNKKGQSYLHPEQCCLGKRGEIPSPDFQKDSYKS